MIQRVRDFLARYERANSSSDVGVISALYAEIFMFAGPNGIRVINRADFLKLVPQRKAHFLSMGLSETTLASVDVHPLDSKYLQAKVTWRLTLRDRSGTRNLDAFATYVLIGVDGEELSIVFQLDHQDLATVIKETQNA
jgi:hypothetical protein